MVIRSITRLYPDHSKTIVYNRPLLFEPPTCSLHALVSCQVCFKRGKHSSPFMSSIQRTKSRLRDYVVANSFELFCTFTYNPDMVDSFDIEHSKKVMSKWLNNARRSSPDLVYIVVAEKHKSGRIHFHALFKNYRGELRDSGKAGRSGKLYNIAGWKYGFSTAVKVSGKDYGHEKVGSYMMKYVTKDMITVINKRRYWASRNLVKPEKIYNVHREIEEAPVFITAIKKFEYFSIVRSELPASLFRDSITGDDTLSTEKEYIYHE